MKRYQGNAVVPGIAAGKIYVIRRKNEYKESGIHINIEEERQKIRRSVNLTMRQLEILTDEARMYAGENAASIFEAHQMILMDEEFTDSIEEILQEEQIQAELAVSRTGERFFQMFTAMDMDYMRERAADIRDITERILRNMNEEEVIQIQQLKNSGPIILVAESLNPSDIFRFGRDAIHAVVTTQGSATSHVAILARSMNIPAIIHVERLPLEELKNGESMIVDSEHSEVICDPDEAMIEEAQNRQQEKRKEEEALKAYIGVKSVTSTGREVKVYSYVNDLEDANQTRKYDGDGIGLYRSEFLFMGRNSFPNEEEQFQSYRLLVKCMEGKPVIVRTMDIGSDKPLDYFKMEHEVNPALGLRGIRVSLKYPELFKVQLRALFRAAIYGDLSIMYPLITSTVELDNIQKVIAEAVQELEMQNLPYRIPKQGITIETPVAVMISDELAERVDFFSIGTNDLAQYALGIDRSDTDLNLMHNPQHEGILRMIDMTIQAGHRHGIRVGICGEMASDETLIRRFVNMGVDEVSVAPAGILKIRKIISEI